MDLPAEVQASIIKVAGDWSTQTTNLSLKLHQIKPVQDSLLKYFTDYYDALVSILETNQKKG